MTCELLMDQELRWLLSFTDEKGDKGSWLSKRRWLAQYSDSIQHCGMEGPVN
jgi:hypothetical protein